LTDIVDPSERLNLVGAFTTQFNPDNEFFFQGTYVRNKTRLLSFSGYPGGDVLVRPAILPQPTAGWLNWGR
jgi:hypothetical protein